MLHEGQKIEMERRAIYASIQPPSCQVTVKTVQQVQITNGTEFVTFKGIKGLFAVRVSPIKGNMIIERHRPSPIKYDVISIDGGQSLLNHLYTESEEYKG